jgi:di/tricarboxylate transporter
MTLAQSRLGTALGFNVIAILRMEQKILAPESTTVLHSGDQLVVIGRIEHLRELAGWQQLVIKDDSLTAARLISEQIDLVEARLTSHSQLLGETVARADFRKRYGVNVLAILRDSVPRRTNLLNITLRADDTLLLQAPRVKIEALHDSTDLIILGPRRPGIYRLAERLLEVRVPPGSTLVGKSLEESRLGNTYNLNVVSILRQDETIPMPGGDQILQVGDNLIIEGRIEDAEVIRGLQELEVDEEKVPIIQILESEEYGIAEALLHPRTHIVGQTLKELNFREKYRVNVLAIWSGGHAYRSNLYNHILHFGDALLLYGRREYLKVLGSSADFLVLTQEGQEPPLFHKAWLAASILALALLCAIIGWIPISIATAGGATLIVLTGCLSMNEAYKAIDFQAIVLIAGMLPLGIAIDKTGAARLAADGVVQSLGILGPTAVLAGLFLLTCFASQIMPNAAVVVLMGPIAIKTAVQLGLSPYVFLMTVAIATSICVLFPISHPANMIIMGPGGYRPIDYIQTGLPIIILALLITVLGLPLLWPL